MPQLRYESTQVAGVAGMPASSHLSADVFTGINDDPRAKQIVEFAVGEAATAGALTLQNIEFSVSGEADEDAVAAALADAINAEPLVNGAVIAESATDTVTVTARVGGVGFEYEDGSNTTATESQANAEADDLPFGRAVVLTGQDGNGNLLVKRIDSDTDVVGIAQYTATFEKGQVSGLAQESASDYPGGSCVNVLRKGRIYVAVESAVSVGDSVYVRHTASGSLDDLGAFAGSSGTGLAAVSNARWASDSSNGIAILQCDFL